MADNKRYKDMKNSKSNFIHLLIIACFFVGISANVWGQRTTIDLSGFDWKLTLEPGGNSYPVNRFNAQDSIGKLEKCGLIFIFPHMPYNLLSKIVNTNDHITQ